MFKSRMTAICGLCWTSDGPRTFPPRFPWSTWQWIPLASFSSLAYVGSIDTACTPHGHRMDTAWTHGKKVAPCAELWDNALPQVDALGKLWVYLDVLKASRTMCNKRILLLSDIFCLHVMNVHICSYQIYSHILISKNLVIFNIYCSYKLSFIHESRDRCLRLSLAFSLWGARPPCSPLLDGRALFLCRTMRVAERGPHDLGGGSGRSKWKWTQLELTWQSDQIWPNVTNLNWLQWSWQHLTTLSVNVVCLNAHTGISKCMVQANVSIVPYFVWSPPPNRLLTLGLYWNSDKIWSDKVHDRVWALGMGVCGVWYV